MSPASIVNLLSKALLIAHCVRMTNLMGKAIDIDVKRDAFPCFEDLGA